MSNLKWAVSMAFVLNLICISFLRAADDWQYWNEVILEHDLAENVSSEIAFEVNLIDNCSDCTLLNGTVGVFYEFNDLFKLGAEYKYEEEEDGGVWLREHRKGIVAVLSGSCMGLKFQSKTKVEHRDFEDEDSWRAKEKIKIKRDIEAFSLEITPYISNEIYHDFDEDVINQNRAQVGFSKSLMHNLELTLYYMNKANKKLGSWHSVNVAGTEIVMSF